MRIKAAVHGSELYAFLAHEIKQQALAPVNVPGAAVQSKVLSTAKAREWLNVAHQAADVVGRMPPEPPTLRARAGAVVVQAVRRMLFWLTPQINSAHQALLSVIQEQTTLIDQLAGQVAMLKDQLNDLTSAQSRGFQRFDSDVARMDNELIGFVKSSESAREATRQLLERQIVQLRTVQFGHERRMSELTKPAAQATAVSVSSHANDSLYLHLEDRFRGSREDVKSRLGVYLPYLKDAAIAGGPVLDLGCGRGEWLELLRENGVRAEGVDLNTTFASYCQELGFDVTLDDALANLKQRPDDSFACVSGFHIVEHLPWESLVELIDASIRVVRPGGMVIFETPNPENIQVGSKNFYFDPTHRHPLPPMLLEFLLDARGLCGIEVLQIHPYPASMRLVEDGLAVTQRVNEFFYGPQDYAVIGRKPKA